MTSAASATPSPSPSSPSPPPRRCRRRRRRQPRRRPSSSSSPPPRWLWPSSTTAGTAPSSMLLAVVVLCVYAASHAIVTTSALGLPNDALTAAPAMSGGGAVVKSDGGSPNVNAASVKAPAGIQGSRVTPIRVAFQGEPGAHSEKSLRELLGPNVIAVGYPDFESCYRAVASREVDYACLPVENSLGGSIHDNYDLMLRYDLTIVAEHEHRVKHCLLAMPGVEREDVKYAISHPQALAQCDTYLRGMGIKQVPGYDTAGAAKMIARNQQLPEGCTPENTAAIASDLAGKLYGMSNLDSGIEDDDTNFTRFLLLGRAGVVQYLNKRIPSKTSIVFTLPNTPGALYKALACFSLRDIDFTKIESRPTSASLLSFLKFRSQAMGRKRRNQAELPRFRYCFYLDFLASELDESAQYALSHLREQADFCRVLGSYPAKSRLVGPVAEAVERLRHAHPDELGGGAGAGGENGDSRSVAVADDVREEEEGRKLSIGIVGYGAFGQYLGRKFTHFGHSVRCLDIIDKSKDAERAGHEFFQSFDTSNFLRGLDVVVLAVPLMDFEDVVGNLPADKLGGKLVVEVCPLSSHPKSVLLRSLPADADIICSHPMFGPHRGTPKEDIDAAYHDDVDDMDGAATQQPHQQGLYTPESWDGQPYVYDPVRTAHDAKRAESFLHIFRRSRCQMVQMTAEQHDECTADAEFVTHLTGRLLGERNVLPPTPVASKEYAALCDVVDLTSGDTFDRFYGMFVFNDRARGHLNKMRENLAKVERQLAAKEAYLAARDELRDGDRRRLVAECRSLLEEALRTERVTRKGLPAEEEEEKVEHGGDSGSGGGASSTWKKSIGRTDGISTKKEEKGLPEREGTAAASSSSPAFVTKKGSMIDFTGSYVQRSGGGGGIFDRVFHIEEVDGDD